MAKKKVDVFSLVNSIITSSKKVKCYGSGLIGEHIFVASYQRMPIGDLEKVNYLVNRILKEKKEYQRVEIARNKK